MSEKSKYRPDWNQTQGKVSKSLNQVLIHPYDLIALVHKKKGMDEAGKLAVKILSNKYEKIFDDSKI